jgi:hypothetical protein
MIEKLLLIYLLSATLLTNGSKNLENNEISNSIDNQQQVVEDTGKNDIISENEKYKFSDSYYFDFTNSEYQVNYNVVEDNEKIIKEAYVFKSDNAEFTITLGNTIELNGNPIMSKHYSTVDGESQQALIKFDDEGFTYDIAIIDLDENDNYKEIFVTERFGSIYLQYNIYRVQKDGLVEIFDMDVSRGIGYPGGLCKINGNWIFNLVFAPYNNLDFVTGYYLYEDGEFKYIDRFHNGEKLTDEEGNFPEGLKSITFTADEWCFFVESDNIHNEIFGKFNLMSCKNGTVGSLDSEYTIRILEDVELSGEVIPAGTVVENVRLFYY